ncbi:MAG: hypothetical protein RLZZ245_2685 [Verrucomicrobiota bacterium]|jgi:hypothetical protein
MLDADEAASFDEAARQDPELEKAYREVNCIAAAVAAATSTPLAPRAGQLARLQSRLGLNTSKRTNWLGISGWAAAAALAMLVVIEHQTTPPNPTAAQSPPPKSNADSSLASHPQQAQEQPVSSDTTPLAGDESAAADTLAGTPSAEDRTITRVETKRLIQEIEVLREKLESAQERDQKRFQAVDGMAWPIVMRMSPPGLTRNGAPGISSADPEPPALTAMLGDALAGNSPTRAAFPMENLPDTRNSLDFLSAPLLAQATRQLDASGKPSAVPIYDAARDTGTLVVSNLPEKSADESYNLWVKTEDVEEAIHVGLLPDTVSVAPESFDFSLGSAAIIPREFFLTKDAVGEPVAPSEGNTILQGPQ